LDCYMAGQKNFSGPIMSSKDFDCRQKQNETNQIIKLVNNINIIF